MASGPSPLDKQQKGPQGSKEQTPEMPNGAQPGEKPGEKPGQETAQGQKPGQKPGDRNQPGRNGQPLSNQEDVPGDSANRAGPLPPAIPTGRVSAVNTIDRWGELPVHHQEIFKSEGGGNMPPQYRDWIESYYRRLNK